MWIAILTPTLDAAPENTTVKRLEQWFSNFQDNGMSMLFKSLVPEG